MVKPTSKSAPCTICNNTSGHCKRGDGDLILCHNHEYSKGLEIGGYKAIKQSDQWCVFAPSGSTPPPKTTQSKAPIKKLALTAQARDKEFREFMAGLTLHPGDQADLHRRGLTEAQIKSGGYVSIEGKNPGYLCPCYNPGGLIVGAQYRLRDAGDGARYKWISWVGGGSKFDDELPLTCHRPINGTPTGIAIVEGIGAKSFILAQKSGMVTIGAGSDSQFVCSPKHWERYLSVLSEELSSKVLHFYPDSGAVQNPSVLGKYRQFFEFAAGLGYEVTIAWWGQTIKGEVPDVDELADFDGVKWITVVEFEAIAQAQLAEPEESIVLPAALKMRRPAAVKDSELAEFAVNKWQGDLIYSSEIESWVRYGQTQEGVWSVVSEDQVASEALDLAHKLAGEFKWSLVAGGVKAARVNSRILKPSMPVNPDILVFQNGALKISTQQLLPHSRENNALWALQRKYDPAQSDWSPIAEFVSKALWSKADQDRMVAFHAATIRDLFRKMVGQNKKNTLLQIGESGSGKGTSTRLMEQLVGEPNIKPIESIQALCSKDFGLDGIEAENPRLLIVADQEKLPPRLAIARFLMLTGLDLVDVSRKYKRGARYRHTGGFVINSTEYVFSAFHRSRGATRRTVLLQSWRKDPALSGIESRFTPEVISAYTNFLLSLPEQWVLDTLESAPGEPTIENESLDNPMMAWFLDCVEITGNAADRVQLGRNKNAAEQLFSSYFDYCEKANIGSGYSKNHVTFAKEFEQIYARLKSTMAGSGKAFGHLKPGNKLHYLGLRLKPEADDTSRLQQFETLRPEQSKIDSPVQQGLKAQLGEVELLPIEPIPAVIAPAEPEPDNFELEFHDDIEDEPDNLEPPELAEPAPTTQGWEPAIGDQVAFDREGQWVRATVLASPKPQADFYKIQLTNGATHYSWSRDNLRPISEPCEVVA
jgi:D5 N terminal like